MAAGYSHPKVKVHVGDGFKFLDDYKNEFDVIITDSSDPEGPAESLFQKPYFQLLHGALREGGVITTQGCTSPYSGRSEGPEGNNRQMQMQSGYPGCLILFFLLSALGIYLGVARLGLHAASFSFFLAWRCWPSRFKLSLLTQLPPPPFFFGATSC